MLKRIGIAAGILLSASGWACDVCGCRPGGMSGDPLYFNRSFVSLGYQHNTFHSTHINLFDPNDQEQSTEYFRTMVLGGRWSISPRWSTTAAIPIAFNTYSLEGETSQQNALGDITILGTYRWKMSSDDSPWESNISAGLKLPTGPWSASQNNDIPASMLPGTGSLDFIATTRWSYRHSDAFATRVFAMGKWNTANSEDYHFGNQYNVQLSEMINFWSSETIESAAWIEMGYRYLFDGADSDYTGVDFSSETSGYFHSATIGLTYQWKDLAATFSTFIPISQQFGGGLVKSDPLISFQVSYYF